MVSSDTSTRSIRDSTLTAVLMPCLDDGGFVVHNVGLSGDRTRYVN